MIRTTITRYGATFLVYILGINFFQALSHKIEVDSPTTQEEVLDLSLTFTGNESQSTIFHHSKTVVCYVGTWAVWRSNEGQFEVENIDASLCTHLIYTFAALDNLTFILKPMDPWLDIYEHNGGGKDWYRKFTNLKTKYPHLKLLLAVGGYSQGCKTYFEMVAEDRNREKFVQSALDLLRKYSFDGLDMDWDCPGSRQGLIPKDKRQFTILVQELRLKFDDYGLMLSAAFSGKSKVGEGYELRELARLLDHFHIKAYDYHGAWEEVTSHNAPLFTPSGQKISVEYTVNQFISYGVPVHKIVLGMPLFGRTYILSDFDSLGSGINEAAQNTGFQGPLTKEDGFLGYNEICKMLISDRGHWKNYWDKSAMVPYMRNEYKWASFDNPDSIDEKVSFLLAKGLKGAMIWSLDTDDFRGTCGVKYPLLRTINYALSKNETFLTYIDTATIQIF